MPAPYETARAAALGYRRLLLEHEGAATGRMLRQFRRYHRALRQGIRELENQLEEGQELTISELGRMEAWRSLDRQLRGESATFIRQWGDDLQSSATWATDLGLEATLNETLACYRVADQVAVVGAWHQLHTSAVIETLGFFQPGSPLVARLAMFPDLLTEHLQAAILDGLALGYNPRKVARNVARATGQALDWCTRWTRTVHLQAYRGASHQAYQDNADVVGGWYWLAALDTRLCASCLAMHGTWHPNSERLDDHWNGRCCPVPAVKDVDGVSPIPVDLPDGEAWFQALSQGEQESILGKGWRQLWDEGRISLGELSRETEDAVWGTMRVVRPLKDFAEFRRNSQAVAQQLHAEA